MNAATARKRAQECLDYIRAHHAEDHGSARCVGYVWNALAAIAGDTEPAPWEETLQKIPAERRTVSP